MTWPHPPLARSIFGWDPLDEFSTTLADWMVEVSQGNEHLEVCDAKKKKKKKKKSLSEKVGSNVDCLCTIRLKEKWGESWINRLVKGFNYRSGQRLSL